MRRLPRPSLRRRVGPRLVLASGVAFGLASLARMAVSRGSMLGVNFRVYYLAAEAAVTGGSLYAVAAPGFPNLPYVYPPAVALAFLPYLAVGWHTGFALHTIGALAACLALAAVLVGLVERRGRRLSGLDRALVAAFVVASVHTVPSLFYGNVNPHLALALALGAVALDRGRGRSAGVAFAVPAVVKVFPAAFGVWLLRRRDWRAVGAAAATGLAALVAGALAFGLDAHRAYVFEALLPRRRTAAFVGGLDPGAPYVTLRRPLSMVLPSAPDLLAPLAVALLAPVVVWVYADPDADDLVALHVAVVAVLLALPSYFTYYVFAFVTLVPLLYLLDGTAGTLFTAGALVGNLAVTLDTVRNALGGTPAEPALAVLGPVLSFGTPPLYGLLLTLAGCVAYRRAGG